LFYPTNRVYYSQLDGHFPFLTVARATVIKKNLTIPEDERFGDAVGGRNVSLSGSVAAAPRLPRIRGRPVTAFTPVGRSLRTMADIWYYAHDGTKSGPLSGRQLKDLADTDHILPTDTVWKEGTARGVSAGKVKYLFTAALAKVLSPLVPIVPAEATMSPPDTTADNAARPDPCPCGSPDGQSAPAPEATAPVEGEAELVPASAAADEAPPAAATTPPPLPLPVRRARAIAGSGTEIVGQDGTNVRFRKRCVTCGHKDTSWQTMRIVNGLTHLTFYCPKCRKSRGAEIRGSLN
jgi:hypothetical protein